MKKNKQPIVADTTALDAPDIDIHIDTREKAIKAKKKMGSYEFIILFGLIMSLTALTISALVPAMNDIQQDFALVDIRSTQLIVSLFIFGMVFGELIFGPIADSIGRKPVITIGIIIYLLGTVIAMLSSSLTWLLVGRVIQGIGVSGPKIGARALVRDTFKGDAMAKVMSFMMMLLILMPMLAPILGQWILVEYHWRAIFVLFFVMSIILCVWFNIRQHETLKAKYRQKINLVTLRINFQKLWRHSFVMSCTLIAGLTFGVHMAFVNTAQSIFQDVFALSNNFVYYFSLLALFSGIASFVNAQIVMKFGMMALTKMAFVLIIASTLLALFYQLITQSPLPLSWFLTIFTLVFFAIGIIFGNINSMAMQYCGAIAGTASSVISSLSSLVAVLVSIAVGRLYQFTMTPLLMTYFLVSLLSLLLLMNMTHRKAYNIH